MRTTWAWPHRQKLMQLNFSHLPNSCGSGKAPEPGSIEVVGVGGRRTSPPLASKTVGKESNRRPEGLGEVLLPGLVCARTYRSASYLLRELGVGEGPWKCDKQVKGCVMRADKRRDDAKLGAAERHA